MHLSLFKVTINQILIVTREPEIPWTTPTCSTFNFIY